MKCWSDIIGVRGLCVDKDYKYYIDDYGIGLKHLSKVADDKYFTGKKLFETKVEQAWNTVFNDISFNGFKANKILSKSTIGTINQIAPVPFVGLKGITFNLLKCELTSFYIKTIKLCVKIGGQTQIIIRINGVDSILFDGIIANDTVQEIAVNDYISSNFQVLVLGDNITVCNGNSNVDCNCTQLYFSVNGVQNYGLIVDLQVRCYPYEYLCNYVDLLYEAVIYKLSALLWKEMLDSNRFNDFLNIKLGENNSSAVTQLAWLDSTYNLLKYDLESSKLVQNGMYQIAIEKIKIPTPDCSCCLECNSSFYKISIP